MLGGRGLKAGERRLLEAVLGPSVRLDRVRLHRGGFVRFTVTLGDHLLLPPDFAFGDFSQEGVRAQALLVHEAVHVWQFQTRPLRTLRSWAFTVAMGGYGPGLPGYRYILPVASFDSLGLERQASVVEHAFLLSRGVRTPAMPQGLKAAALRGLTPFPITD